MSRIAVLFIPSLMGLLWQDNLGVSIVWSLAGSLFIALIAQTSWFQESGENLPVTQRPLRPLFMYNLMFVAYHVVGGAFYTLDAFGYTFEGLVGGSREHDLTLAATAQALMLLAHASVITGMKLAG